MGITYIEGIVRGSGGKQETVRFLVDSRATYSLLPQAIWRTLELTPTPAILGEPEDEALLGVVILEILGLVFNPFNRTLQPMRMVLV